MPCLPAHAKTCGMQRARLDKPTALYTLAREPEMCGVHAGPACHLGSGDVQSQAIPFQPGGLEGAANLSMDSS